MIAAIPSAVLVGVDGKQVSVEVHVSNGLPGFTVVGLPDAAVREARDRVRAALLSSGLPWPLRRVTVNLAPSGMRKGGSGLDLPIAVGVLVASGELDQGAIEGMAFLGELGLDGSLRGVPGVMVLADALARHRLVVPSESTQEALLSEADDIRASGTLGELVDRLSARRPWPPTTTAGVDGETRLAATESAHRRRPVGGEGPAPGLSGARDRGDRRSPSLAGRAARFGQDHARLPPP